MYENVPKICNENPHQALCRKQMTRAEHELANALIHFLRDFAPWVKETLVALLTNLSSTHTCENLYTATNYVKTNLAGILTDESEPLVGLSGRPAESAGAKW